MAETLTLTKPEVNRDRLERTMQELWLEWVRHYFSGAPVEVIQADGTVAEETFALCVPAFQQMSLPQDQTLPILHFTAVDGRERDRAYTGYGPTRQARDDGSRYRRLWQEHTWHVLVQVSVTGHGNANHEPDWLCRQVAGDLHRLLTQEGRDALTEKGIQRLRVISGPRPVPAVGYQQRQLVLTFQTAV